MNNWFEVDNSVVDRDDLTVYEKMACVVLARYAGKPEFNNLLSMDIIAVKMGVSTKRALEAMEGLQAKGLLLAEDDDQVNSLIIDQTPGKVARIISPREEVKQEVPPWQAFGEDEEVVHHEDPEPQVLAPEEEAVSELAEKEPETEVELDLSILDEEEDLDFEDLRTELLGQEAEEPQAASSLKNTSLMAMDREDQQEERLVEKPRQTASVKKSIEELTVELSEIIEERINDREARIILGMANNDLNRVRVCYARAKKTQVSDPVDMLIHELQKPVGGAVKPERRRSADPVQAESRTVVERIAKNVREDKPPVGGQINTLRLHQMKKYKQYGKSPNKK